MAIILNEYRYALEILEKHLVGSKPSETLSILARYYRHKENKKDREIFQLLDMHMKNFSPNYNSVKWSITIDNQVKKSKKYPLIEIDFIPVTKSEIGTINNLKTIRMKRLAFTILVCAKFSNLRNTKNNNWVNLEGKELFKLAHIGITTAEQCNMIHELNRLGLVSFSQKVDNTNLRVEFINDDSDIVIQITDMRELGYTYLKYIGDNIVECERCGRLINPRGTKRKYCTECSEYQPVVYKTINCIDCGKEVVVDATTTTKNRCDECYIKYRREYYRETKRKQRLKIKE